MNQETNRPHNEISVEEYEKIKIERDFYKKILDKIPAVVHVNNLNTQLVDWVNDTAERFSGYKREFMVQNPDFLQNVIVEEDLEWFQESIAEYKQLEGIYSNIYSMKLKDGSIATYHGLGVVFETDENNKPIRNLAIDVDITTEIRNYKQLKSHLDELTRKLRKTELDQLTKAEIKVIVLLCKGNTLKQVATELDRSVHTIDNHKRNIFNKINVHKISELVVWAKDVGLV